MNTKALKVFFIYAIVLTVSILLGVISLYVIKSKFLYIFIVKLYNICEYCLFATFLYYLFKNKLAQKIVLYSILPFLIIALYNYFISTKAKFSNFPSLVEFLAFIVFIIYFFYEKMNTVVEYPLYQSISFWICMGLFIYFTGTFFYFLFINSGKDKQFVDQMKLIYCFVTICKDIMICVAFLANEQNEVDEQNQLHIPNELNLDSFSPHNNLN